MTTATPENATSWRDLIDELTPEQVSTLAAWERGGGSDTLSTHTR